jgi:hypothetical protein
MFHFGDVSQNAEVINKLTYLSTKYQNLGSKHVENRELG